MASTNLNQGNIMKELMNTNNWKSTRRKNYSAWICKPALNTTVVDVTTDLTQSTNNKNQFVLSGTIGELRTISIDELSTDYTFADGVRITPESLQKKLLSNGQMDWTKVESRLDYNKQEYAFHVPTNIPDVPITNARGNRIAVNWSHVKNHGKGDFITCPSKGGSPDFYHLSVVNGEVFPRTYTLTSFKGLFDTDKMETDPEKPNKVLITAPESGDSRVSKIDSHKFFMKELQKTLSYNKCKVDDPIHDSNDYIAPSYIGLSGVVSENTIDVWTVEFVSGAKDQGSRVTMVFGESEKTYLSLVMCMDDYGFYEVNSIQDAKELVLKELNEFIEQTGYKGIGVIKAIVNNCKEIGIPILGSPEHLTQTEEDFETNEFGDCDVWEIQHTQDKSVISTILIENKGYSSGIQVAMTVNNDFRDPELARSVSNACMIIKHALHDTGVPCYGSPSESTPAQSSSPNGVSKAQIEENWKANASIMNQVSKQLRIEGIKVNIHHDSKNTFNPNNRDLNVDDIWGIEAVPGDTPQATQGSVKIKFAYGQQRTADDIVKEIKNGLGISTKKTTKSLIGSWFSRK